MEANTLQEIISRAADSYGSQTAFRYKVKRELEEKTYEDLHRDTMAFGRMLEEKGMRGKHIAVIGLPAMDGSLHILARQTVKVWQFPLMYSFLQRQSVNS